MKESTKDIISRSGVDISNPGIEVMEALKMSKDMKKIILNVQNVDKNEVRTLVNLFYQIQDIRIATSEQIRSIERRVSSTGTSNEGNLIILNWVLSSVAATEKGIKDSLELICRSDPVGQWLLQIQGIGPALAAGCLAYFDVTGRNYASSFISYGGLNDNNRPWLGKERSKKIIEEVLAENHPGEKKIIITNEDVEKIAAKTQWKFGYLRDNAYIEKGKWSKSRLQDAIEDDEIITQALEQNHPGEKRISITDDDVELISDLSGIDFEFLKDKAFEEKSGWDRGSLEKACAKIPYNADLKTLLWKVGKSFEYLKANKKSLYGRLLSERLAKEITKNENGDYKPLIERHLSEKNYKKGTQTYKAYMEGKLPMSEINARCRRWVEKIFVSHLFEEMFRVANNKIPPRYYALEHCEGHHDSIDPEVPYTVVTGEDVPTPDNNPYYS